MAGANRLGAIFTISRPNSRHSRYLLEPGLYLRCDLSIGLIMAGIVSMGESNHAGNDEIVPLSLPITSVARG
jgi:hypothetical protein